MARAKKKRWPLLLLAAAAACLAGALAIVVPEVANEDAYNALSGDAHEEEGDGDIDWGALQDPDVGTNGDGWSPWSRIWLRVSNTPIDYPVVEVPDDLPDDYFLTHDYWGNWSRSGTLYLARGSSPDGRNALVYGHHMGWTGRMFSSIFQCWSQAKFDSLGDALWTVQGQGETVFEPLCAMSVDKAYQPIQTYDFSSDEEFHEWLDGILADASAKAPNAQERADAADRVLTLVTCSSTRSGQRARTCVVFAA